VPDPLEERVRYLLVPRRRRKKPLAMIEQRFEVCDPCSAELAPELRCPTCPLAAVEGLRLRLGRRLVRLN